MVNWLTIMINESITQKKVIHRDNFQFQLISEYWSIGVMTKGLMSFFSTLQYSITPLRQCRDFQELLAIFKLPYLLVIIPMINLYDNFGKSAK